MSSDLYEPAAPRIMQELATAMLAPTELSLLVMLLGTLLLVTMVACLTLCLRPHSLRVQEPRRHCN